MTTATIAVTAEYAISQYHVGIGIVQTAAFRIAAPEKIIDKGSQRTKRAYPVSSFR